jgi:glycosyltransferase 2 family protein
MKNNHKKIVKIIGAIILVALLIRSVDWHEVLLYITGVNMIFLVLFILFYCLGLAISAQKWSVLARFVGFDRPYSFYFITYLLGTFFNNFLPSFVGGDTYRTLALGRSEKRLIDSSSTIVFDRISGLFGVLILAALCGLINYSALKNFEYVALFVLAVLALLIGGILAMLLYKNHFVQKLFSILPTSVQKYIKAIMRFSTPFIAITAMNYALFFTVVGIGVTNYLLFIAIGVDISIIDYMSVIFLSSLIAALPISIGNIGTKEWAYIVLFGIFGVSASALVAIVLLSRFLQMIVGLFALPFYVRKNDHLL